jgi:hypothetical protein
MRGGEPSRERKTKPTVPQRPDRRQGGRQTKAEDDEYVKKNGVEKKKQDAGLSCVECMQWNVGGVVRAPWSVAYPT